MLPCFCETVQLCFGQLEFRVRGIRVLPSHLDVFGSTLFLQLCFRDETNRFLKRLVLRQSSSCFRSEFGGYLGVQES